MRCLMVLVLASGVSGYLGQLVVNQALQIPMQIIGDMIPDISPIVRWVSGNDTHDLSDAQVCDGLPESTNDPDIYKSLQRKSSWKQDVVICLAQRISNPLHFHSAAC